MASNLGPWNRHPARSRLERGLAKHPHPATVVQRKPPHAAKESGIRKAARIVERRVASLAALKQRAPHPATVVQAKKPHLAKVLQPMERASNQSAPRTWSELRNAYSEDGRRDRHGVI